MQFMEMSAQGHLQEREYDFPYHHLVTLAPFAQSQHLFWGFKYAAYIQYVIETLAEKKWNSLIDYGCGDGKVTREIACAFEDKRVVGVDYSDKSLRFARAFSPHITFEAKSSEQFDAFVLIEVLEHIDPAQIPDFLSNLSKNLKPGGFGIITTPSTNIQTNPKHYQHFNTESFTKTVSAHFAVERCEYLLAHGLGVRIIQTLLSNRFFVLRWQPLVSLLFRIYMRHYLRARPTDGAQVFAIVRKKD